MNINAATDTLAKRHAILFYLFLFVVGLIVAGLATLDVSENKAIQAVYASTFSSIAAALMVATVLFAIRFWFMIGSSDIFLRRTGVVEGSRGTGIVRVFGQMSHFGSSSEWLSLLSSGRERVDIMGRTSFGWFSNNEIERIIHSRIVDRGVRFRWLIMGPGNPFLPTLIERNQSIGDMLQGKILATTRRLQAIRDDLPDKYKGHLQIHHFSDTPLYCSLVRVDHRILVTHYQSSKDSKSCPMSQLSGLDSAWGESYVSEFDALWENSTAANEGDPQLSGPGLQLDQRMLQELQEQYHSASKRVIDRNRADFQDFNRGWRILFTELIASAPLVSDSSEKKPVERPILRDFTLSAHGSLGCQCWSLQRYPQMLKFNFQEAVEKDYEVRFLLVCEAAGRRNVAAESFLKEVLHFIYRPVDDTRISFSELFNQWRESFDSELLRLKIRLSCPEIVNDVFEDRDSLHPFNVYGDMCVSKSVLRIPNDPSFPSPHLEVLWSSDLVSRHRDLFDKVWDKSLDHQRAIFETPEGDLTQLGDGSLFDRWSAPESTRDHNQGQGLADA